MGQVSGLNGKGKKEEPKKEKRLKVEKEEEEEEEEQEEAEDNNNNNNKSEDDDDDDEEEEPEQDGLSVHSPCKPPPSSKQKDNSDVELELKLLEALEIYPPVKLGGVHRHFVLYGLTEYLRKRSVVLYGRPSSVSFLLFFFPLKISSSWNLYFSLCFTAAIGNFLLPMF
ncbi:OLC1v1032635C1 [Oldenlandia corymbosa var. corymbosa]|uniref:OLC1v1032635C1 n=1 Tax=Oldenlandia corymbosa var. corymbosa TaxID=529605 RepID=A0AAV1CP62_OLDCO|nr:OLC1v1032635C1 [Oldenlandia corymbosa var. corymbosa]